jgi:hypothetical protein
MVTAGRHGLGLGVRLEHEYRSLAASVVEVLVGGPYPRQLRPVAVQLMPGIPGGRAVIFPGKGHLYAAASKAAANIALGFLLAE